MSIFPSVLQNLVKNGWGVSIVMLSDAFTWIVLHPFIAGAVLILCLIVLERLTRRKWPWRFKATVTYVCDGDSVWVKRRIGDRVKLSAYMLTNALRAWEAAR